MTTLSERMNVSNLKIDGAYLIKRISPNFNAYETLCLICSELDTDLKNIEESDFYSASIILNDFMNESLKTDGSLSIWFDK